MPHTLIIGYGNPLRGDDGFGWHAATRLREIIHDAGIEILAIHQLTPELMEPALPGFSGTSDPLRRPDGPPPFLATFTARDLATTPGLPY